MVANDLRRARSFDRARELYERVVSSDAFNDNDKLKALDGIRMSYKLEQNREKFLEETRRYAEFAKQKFYTEALKSKKRPGQYAKYLDTRLTLARAIWTENSPREADQILRAVEKDLKGRYPVDESLFIRARIEEEAGRLDQSVKLLDTINDRRVADRALRQKIQWFRAWNLRKVGKLQEASVLLERLVAEEETPSLQARNRFWLGRVFKDLGEKQKAEDQFNWLIANDPIGYYGTIAYRELGQSLPSLRGATVSRGLASSLLNAKSLMTDEETLFSWLVASDEKDLARRYLDSISQQRRGEWNDEQTLEFLQHYARAGAYQSLFARLSETQPETRKQILERQPELIFPRSWKPLIDSAGAKYGVAPELVMSIIRQESSFNPTARSHADAFGLMQLIPEMAKRASASTGVRVEAHEDLYKPETNIPLGTAFLKELFEKWNNRFIPAVASYNASEKAVLGWLKTRDRKDPLQFIEDIPYEETKGYVKLVMRNYVFYSRMNAGAAGVPFPEWCLQGLQDINP
jgi:soluble lytic murein transglycosylase